MSERFTAWLSDSERDRLRAAAKDNNTSENYIVRIAIRHLFGLPIPAILIEAHTDREETPA